MTTGETADGPPTMLDDNDQDAKRRDSILSEAEVARRVKLLAELRGVLQAAGVRCVLVRKHRLILRYNQGPSEPSGLTDPELHIFAPCGTVVATTDGSVYRRADGAQFAITEPFAAAQAICRTNPATEPPLPGPPNARCHRGVQLSAQTLNSGPENQRITFAKFGSSDIRLGSRLARASYLLVATRNPGVRQVGSRCAVIRIPGGRSSDLPVTSVS